MKDNALARSWSPALALVTLFGGQSSGVEPAALKPNIVLVVADDLGYGDASAYGSPDLQTPALDGIAKRGARFTQFRVNPLCAPTRASMMTGLYSLECGMWRGPGEDSRGPEPEQGWPESTRRIKDDVILLPQLLKAAGYATGIFGKWHLGYDPKNLPNARGFDEFVGFLGGAHPYRLGRNARILHNGEPMEATGHTTDLFADRAIQFLRANRDRPFFCYLPFNAVHGPLRNADRDADSATTEWLEHYEELGIPQPRRDYCAVMSHADARVGDVLQTLRELDLEARTLVIYLSDNGGILHTYPSNNGPLRGGKATTYEGGIRVPAVMQWPGVIPAGSVIPAAAVHFDLFSTILAAAGIAVPPENGGNPVSGINLLPMLRSGGTEPLPDRYLFWDLYGDVGVLHGPWKMVGEISNHHGRFDKAVQEADAATFELYNLDNDSSEQSNLADQHPEIYRELKTRHRQWLLQFAK
jgi:arylsulfatase A-like enzyme